MASSLLLPMRWLPCSLSAASISCLLSYAIQTGHCVNQTALSAKIYTAKLQQRLSAGCTDSTSIWEHIKATVHHA